MSVQDQALEGAKLKDKNPAPSGVLTVTVQAKPGDFGLSPQLITLTNFVHTVRWTCNGLPGGAVLQIHFLQDLRGPFLDLVQNHPEVSGYGNRGPRETVGEYDYRALIVAADGSSRLAGQGRLLNKATKAIGDPRAGGVDTQPEVPPNG
jgi:hypothetical protein